MRVLFIGQYLLLLALYLVMGTAKQPQQVVGDYNDVLMHFAGYAVAGVSVSIAFARQAIWLKFFQLFCFSTLVEIVQYTLPWRSFELKDIAANSLGILVGLACWQVVLWIRTKARVSTENNREGS
ncbi:VanZ family protein [Gilvimarinus xylanilyticus]|uniref:VanZ family protein n=1 Tax=Gilvimarinus xylanilyticus TaxID=2944139 RepID=A0A9X2HT48_9GAMM|nr:VanZ family protein [Gilvimarinus xylanilyticus]MCP8897790.1 VanZ family protein [Gilvimarinus xylanilyticus]